MSETLEDILDEETLADEANFEQEPETAVEGQLVDEGFAQAAAGTFFMVANLFCERFDVKRISQEEAMAVGTAAAQVASFYDMRADPKVMAWLALGSTTLAVVGPRMMEYRQKLPVKPSDPDDGSGQGGAPAMEPGDFPSPFGEPNGS